jgi:hypothetical protein
MALRFKNQIFYHIPKCAGSYVRKVIEKLEEDRQEFCWTHSTPFETKATEELDYVSFAVVRHPITWYESYFRYRVSGMKTWVLDCYFDKVVQDTSFEKFILKVMSHTIAGATTYVGHLFAPYLGVTQLLKVETLDVDLARVLAGFGYEYKPIAPVKVAPRNISTDLSKEVYMRLAVREAGISAQLGYGMYPQGANL